MGSDAVKDLREWQRRAASVQEKALRAAAKAQDRLTQLEAQRGDAEVALAESLEALGATGITRDQAAAFLGVTPASLPNRSGAIKRRPTTDPGASRSTTRHRTGEASGSSVQP